MFLTTNLSRLTIFNTSKPVRLIIFVEEENGDVGYEDIGSGKKLAIAHQVAKRYVGDDVVVGFGCVHLPDALKLDQPGYVGGLVMNIDFQYHIRGISRSVDIAHLLVFISVAMTASHDIAEDG